MMCNGMGRSCIIRTTYWSAPKAMSYTCCRNRAVRSCLRESCNGRGNAASAVARYSISRCNARTNPV
ncbi:hypothetical protein B0H17DRAFT_1087977 [Mycena rosella]|uniref:Uncharacterized protein n=1 Tax=Mycena rosella TaxID=1033263 RepID=A0AAD7D110_MYCRO|nr:hypothetical protein B0H17DRAFT_1087977 [Mycena rosella]